MQQTRTQGEARSRVIYIIYISIELVEPRAKWFVEKSWTKDQLSGVGLKSHMAFSGIAASHLPNRDRIRDHANWTVVV
jgi:hypothetical protein